MPTQIKSYIILPMRLWELFPFPLSCYFRMFTKIGLRIENMRAGSFILSSTQLLRQQILLSHRHLSSTHYMASLR